MPRPNRWRSSMQSSALNAVAPGVIKTPIHTCAARQAAPAWPDGRDLGDRGRDPLSGIGGLREGRDHSRRWWPECGPLNLRRGSPSRRLSYDPTRPAFFPSNGRTLTDDAADAFLAVLTNGKVTGDKVGPHIDLLAEFPYLGPPHDISVPRHAGRVDRLGHRGAMSACASGALPSRTDFWNSGFTLR